MERLIKVWEDIIGTFLCIAAPTGLQIYIMMNTTYTNEGIRNPSKLTIVLLNLMLFILIIGLFRMRELITKRRIMKLEAKLIYALNMKWVKIKRYLLVGEIVLFIIVAIMKIEILMIIIILIIIFTDFILLENRVYGSDEYFILNGNKYYHNGISEWKFVDLYRLNCQIDGKEKYISCSRRKVYDFMEEYFEKYLSDSKSSVRDCT